MALVVLVVALVAHLVALVALPLIDGFAHHQVDNKYCRLQKADPRKPIHQRICYSLLLVGMQHEQGEKS